MDRTKLARRTIAEGDYVGKVTTASNKGITGTVTELERFGVNGFQPLILRRFYAKYSIASAASDN